MKKLTVQQIAFCNNLIEIKPDGSRSMHDYEAYQLAYPSVKKKAAAMAGASRLLKQDHIKAYLAKRTGEVEAVVEQKVEITKDRILEEEGHIAFNDVGQLFDHETGELMPIHKLPENVRRAIASVKVKETEIAGVIHRTYDVKLNEKGRSLDRLEKCFGMQRDKVEADVVVTIRGLIEEIDGKDRGKLPIEME
jgi:hypothetical protein